MTDDQKAHELGYPTEGAVFEDGTRVAYDYDAEGNLTGWHKQPPAGEEHPVDGPEMDIIPDTATEEGEE